MNEEEIAVIKSRNDLLRALKHLRRMHSDKLQKLEESNRTLRRLEEERKQRDTEEAERRRLAEEERLRAHAEAERARQVLDEKRRQFEAESKRQEVENERQAQLSVEQAARTDVQVHGLRRTETTSGQTLQYRNHPKEVGASQQQGIADVTRVRAAPEANSFSSEVAVAMSGDEDGRAFAPHRTVPLSDIHTTAGGSQCAILQPKQKDDPTSGGVMLAVPTPNTSGGHLSPKPSAKPPLSSSDHVTENALSLAKTSPTISVSAEGGHGSSFSAQLASQFNRVVNIDVRSTPDHKAGFSRTPKSQTVLGGTDGGSEELNIGPCSGLSPAQQNINLRHLKRYRGRIEENDSGDRSVRNNVKNEENSMSLKGEGHDDHFRELVQSSPSTNLPASLPPRPVIISPPRPRKRHAAPAFQIVSASSYPPESNKLASIKGKAEAITSEQPREAVSRGSLSSRAVNASVQLPVSAETTNSLLDLVYPEPHASESRISASERPQDRVENR
ncbi:hypothetical protein J3R83DRAFT_3649 [Lanmaoa asiatica]|nr:hypothetical protein J3R83DRAFT_3649 [Lanmaoa asiatica]